VSRERSGGPPLAKKLSVRALVLLASILAASYVIVAGGLLWVLRRLARSPLASPTPQPQGV